jgi:type II secretory pathway pseudopilin PulG
METRTTWGVPGRQGLSYLELVMVLSIMGIMTAVAVPRFAEQLAHHRLESAARQVAADIRFVQSWAYVGSQARRIDFRTPLNRYRIPDMPNPDQPTYVDGNGQTQPAVYNVRLDEEPYHCELVSAQFGTDNSNLIFDGYGRPQNGGSIVLRLGKEIRTITVNGLNGEVTIQ